MRTLNGLFVLGLSLLAAGPVAALPAIDVAPILDRLSDPDISDQPRLSAGTAAAVAKREPAIRSDRRLEGMRILLAEDGPDNRPAVRRWVASQSE